MSSQQFSDVGRSSGKRLKVCLAASAGGHLSQLLKLEAAWRGYDTFLVTTSQLAVAQLQDRFNQRVYVLAESNRQHPLKVLRVALSCARILLAERPHVVLSTGAAHGCVLCLLGRLMRAKIIWVDSIANVDRLSLSGCIVRWIADLYLVQWRHLADSYADVEYRGEVV